MSLGGGEILVILLVALIVFGPQRLPEIGRQVGKAMGEVRKMQDSVRQELHGVMHSDEPDVAHGVGVPDYSDTHTSTDTDRGEPPALPRPDPPSAGSFS